MRIFSLDYRQAMAIPAHFADWAIRFDGVEREVDAEHEAERTRKMWGG